MRTPIIAGNWKLFKPRSEAVNLALELKKLVADVTHCEIVVAPPFPALEAVAGAVKGSPIKVAGQNLYWKNEGAFTGEVSGPMLAAVGCTYVIVGHSERRQFFGETDQTVNLRLKAALASDLIPIFCIGETLTERQAGQTFDVLTRQTLSGLEGIPAGQIAGMVVAYEPVWAIGTGQTATNEQAQEAHKFLRGLLAETYGRHVAEAVRILYGGSVKPNNVDGLMSQPDIDGALVGGASLDAPGFGRIVKFQVNF